MSTSNLFNHKAKMSKKREMRLSGIKYRPEDVMRMERDYDFLLRVPLRLQV